MGRTARWALVVAMGLGAGACSDSSGVDDDDDFEIAGTYTLQTINGNPLPFTVGQVGTSFKLEIMSDVFTINSNMTFRDISVTRVTEDGVPTTTTDTINGTWTANANKTTITFTDDEGTTLNANLTSTGMTASGQGFTFVYRR